MDQFNQMTKTETSEKVDYLKEDPEISRQRFSCVSFVEPTNQELLTDREAYFATHFITKFLNEYKQAREYLDAEKEKIKTISTKVELQKLCKEYSLKVSGKKEDLQKRLMEYIEKEKTTEEINKKVNLSYDNIKSELYNFQNMNLVDLQKKFEDLDKQNERTTMRGLKIRGTFSTYEEAKEKSESLRKFEPAFDVFVVQVGFWIPFNPGNLEDLSVQYDEDVLNDLVKGKVEEDEKRKLDFDERKMKLLDKASKETEKQKQKNKKETELEKIKEEEEVEDINDEDLLEILEFSDDEEEKKDIQEDKKEMTDNLNKTSKKSNKSNKRKNKRNANRRKVNRKK
jgi:hypothetical protein